MLRAKMKGGQIKHVLCLQLSLGGLISKALKEPKAFVLIKKKKNYNNTLDIIWPIFKNRIQTHFPLHHKTSV